MRQSVNAKSLRRFVLLLAAFGCVCLSHAFDIAGAMGQFMSTSQFYLYGRKHFTKTGYEKHVKSYYKEPAQKSDAIFRGAEGADGVDMAGKVVVVTGANKGLGKSVATYCATKGARVYMVCRNKERGEAARKDIVDLLANGTDDDKANGEKNVKVVLADVGELEQVRQAAKEIQSQESKINALVCNAGALLHERQETSEGLEVTFAGHLLGGTYLLSQLLLPQLEACDNKEGRVITVTSGGMYNFKMPKWELLSSSDEESKKKYNGLSAYSFAKRAQVLLMERLAREKTDVKWVTVHPGWSDTPGVDEVFGSSKKYLEPMRTAWQGVEGVCWLVTTDKENIESGALYLDRKPQIKHIAGPFFSEGSVTKNTEQEVDELMVNLKKAANL